MEKFSRAAANEHGDDGAEFALRSQTGQDNHRRASAPEEASHVIRAQGADKLG
jgi:hypothetical protein